MTENANKIGVGLFMIASHFLAIVVLVLLTFIGGFSIDEMTTTIGFIGPLFAGYSSVIIAYIIKHKSDTSYGEGIVNPVYALVSFAVPALFVLIIFSLIFLKAFNFGVTDFSIFKTIIGLVEGAFGLYVGQFIYSMFEAKKTETKG